MAILLAVALLLQPAPATPFTHAVAARCTGEGSHPQAIRICACTVKHRLEAGWGDNVLDAYYAPDVPPTEEGLLAAAAGLNGACQGEEYFLMEHASAIRYFDLDWAVAEAHWDGKAVYAFKKTDWGRKR